MILEVKRAVSMIIHHLSERGLVNPRELSSLGFPKDVIDLALKELIDKGRVTVLDNDLIMLSTGDLHGKKKPKKLTKSKILAKKILRSKKRSNNSNQ